MTAFGSTSDLVFSNVSHVPLTPVDEAQFRLLPEGTCGDGTCDAGHAGLHGVRVQLIDQRALGVPHHAGDVERTLAGSTS